MENGTKCWNITSGVFLIENLNKNRIRKTCRMHFSNAFLIVEKLIHSRKKFLSLAYQFFDILQLLDRLSFGSL